MKPGISTLKAQDVLILLKLITLKGQSYRAIELALAVGISQSEVSQGLERLRFARILSSDKKHILPGAAFELLVFAVKYFFPVAPGAIVAGIPTAHSAPPFISKNDLQNSASCYVWSCADGNMRGQAIEPLYPSVVKVVQRDQELYQLLTLVDVLRIGRTREQKVAKELFKKILLENIHMRLSPDL